MKRTAYVIVNILEIALLIGTYIINYFTVKKMGMLRWVVFKNMTWEKVYPVAMLKITTAVILAAATAVVFLFFLKRRKQLKKIAAGMNILMLVLTSVYLGYTIGYSTELMKAYYLISLMLVLAALLQIVKSFVGILACKREE